MMSIRNWWKGDISRAEDFYYPTLMVACWMAVLLLASCGAAERINAGINRYSRICVDGVSYLQFTSGASVEYLRNGTIRTC